MTIRYEIEPTRKGIQRRLDAQGLPTTSPLRATIQNVGATHRALAYDGDQIVGGIGFTPDRVLKDAHIVQMRVLDQHKGIGTGLLATIARSLPPGWTMVVTSPVHSARAFYEKTGAESSTNPNSSIMEWSAEAVDRLRGQHTSANVIAASTKITYEIYRDEHPTGRLTPGRTWIVAFDGGGGGVGHLCFWNTDHGESLGEIYSMDVAATHRRRGVATEMLRRAREVEPRVHHSDSLTDDGEAWSQHVASAALPTGYTLKVREIITELWGLPQIWVTVMYEGREVGGVAVHQRMIDGKLVGHPNIAVDEEHQRKGLATALYAEVKRRWPHVPIVHSENASDAAKALNRTLALTVASHPEGSRRAAAFTPRSQVGSEHGPEDSATRTGLRDAGAHAPRDHRRPDVGADRGRRGDRLGGDRGGADRQGARRDDVRPPVRLTAAAAPVVKNAGPFEQNFAGYSPQRQILLLSAIRAFKAGKTQAKQKDADRSLAGCWTIPVGAKDHGSTADRIILIPLKTGEWLAVDTVVNHNYGIAEVRVPAWLRSKDAEQFFGPRTSRLANMVEDDEDLPPGWKGPGIYEMDISRWSSTGCVAYMVLAMGKAWPIAWMTWDKQRFTIEGVWVMDDYRKHGIAAELKRQAEKICGNSLSNDSGEYTVEGLAWAKKHGIPKAKNTSPVSKSDMARMIGQMNSILIGGHAIKRQVLKTGARTASALRFEHLKNHLAEDLGHYVPSAGTYEGDWADVLVAYDGAKPVAHLGWMTHDGFTKGSVDIVYVDPAYRRRGIASDLLRRAKAIDPDVDVQSSAWFTDEGRSWADSLR